MHRKLRNPEPKHVQFGSKYNRDFSLKLIKELSEAFGPPGDEGEVRKCIQRNLPPQVGPRVDKWGNLIFQGQSKGKGSRIMLDAHTDEVGLMVSRIDKSGFLRVVPIGGWWPVNLVDKKWTILTRSGRVTGVSNSSHSFNAHISDRGSKPVEDKDVFLDIGASSEREAREEFGVALGDFVAPDTSFFQLSKSDLYCGKALDDRLGCALMVEAFCALAEEKIRSTLIGVGSVQEEVGARGVDPALHSIKPDVAIVLEVAPALDYPNSAADHLPDCKLGSGPMIHLLNSASIAHRKFVRLTEEIAHQNQINLQYWTMPMTYNNGRFIERFERGIPTLSLCVPIRHFHNHLSVFHFQDYQNALTLLINLIKKLDQKAVQELSQTS